MLRVDKSIVVDWKEKEKKKKQKIGKWNGAQTSRNGVENRKTILKYSIGDFLGAVVQLQ